MSVIRQVKAQEILDSRGNPTVEVEVGVEINASSPTKSVNHQRIIWSRASVPSGASTGVQEAVELRDKDLSRFDGRGVLKAVHHVNTEINDLLVGKDSTEQRQLDNALVALDGTANKSRLGANALLGTSIALAKASALVRNQPLYEYLALKARDMGINTRNDDSFIMPVPQMNILNGGAHANNNVDIQEFMILPVAANSFSESLRWGSDVFRSLKALLKRQGLLTSVGDEGGFAPNFSSNKAVLDCLMRSIEIAGYKPGKDIYLGLDIASSVLYKDGLYYLPSEERCFSPRQFIAYLESLLNDYPILSIEDAMAEDDWEGWEKLTQKLGNTVQLVGDDLFVTNESLLSKGFMRHVANAILIKPNQAGTLTETFQAVCQAQKQGYGVIISHRSGETEDTTIADLAVAVGAGQIKTGALCRTDRVAKYNQLLRIESTLKAQGLVDYAGMAVYKHLSPS